MPIDSEPDAPVASSASAAALELGSLLAMLARLAATDAGGARLQSLAPASGEPELVARRQRYEEVERLLADGALVPSFEEPLLPVVERLAGGEAATETGDLLAVGRLLAASGAVGERLAALEPPAASLGTAVSALPDLEPLRRRIAKVLDRRGRVRDDASPRLEQLRRRISRQRAEVYKTLSGALEEHREHLAEETVPLHEGRLVLLLKAGARGTAAGLVHGRSASGRSLYFEPLPAVEANNRLSEAVESDLAERRRLVVELVREAGRQQAAIRSHLDLVAELDALQAACRLASRSGGRLAEIAAPGELVIRQGVHPLLDPRLAALRESALGVAGHRSAAVPLDLELGPERRVLTVTGPNAGGKTVALKTVGLFALATQCGLPVAAAAGTRLPLCGRLVASVGDEQDLLAERSTFSARLLRLREAWEAAGPGSLVLLDELGSGTDPEEGAALAVALVEELVDRGGLAVVTTHLGRLAARALELDGAGCAAMELDPVSGVPTYRLLPGTPGGSEALTLARRLELPAAWLARAEALVDPQEREWRKLLSEVEKARRDLAEKMVEVERRLDHLGAEQAEIAAAREQLEVERRGVAGRLRGELAAFRRQVRAELDNEVERLRQAVESGRRRGLAAASVERLFSAEPEGLRPPPPEDAGSVEPGAWVRHTGLGWEGRLERVARGRAEVQVGGKRVRCPVEALTAIAEPPAPTASRRPARSNEPRASEVQPELRLIGKRVEPALEELDRHLDQALLAGLDSTRIVHGHGSGKLRAAVRAHLDGHPAVAGWRPGGAREGGDGATVVELEASPPPPSGGPRKRR